MCLRGREGLKSLCNPRFIYIIFVFPVKCIGKKNKKSCTFFIFWSSGWRNNIIGCKTKHPSINTSIAQIAAVFSLFFIKKLLLDIVGWECCSSFYFFNSPNSPKKLIALGMGW